MPHTHPLLFPQPELALCNAILVASGGGRARVIVVELIVVSRRHGCWGQLLWILFATRFAWLAVVLAVEVRFHIGVLQERRLDGGYDRMHGQHTYLSKVGVMRYTARVSVSGHGRCGSSSSLLDTNQLGAARFADFGPGRRVRRGGLLTPEYSRLFVLRFLLVRTPVLKLANVSSPCMQQVHVNFGSSVVARTTKNERHCAEATDMTHTECVSNIPSCAQLNNQNRKHGSSGKCREQYR